MTGLTILCYYDWPYIPVGEYRHSLKSGQVLLSTVSTLIVHSFLIIPHWLVISRRYRQPRDSDTTKMSCYIIISRAFRVRFVYVIVYRTFTRTVESRGV